MNVNIVTKLEYQGRNQVELMAFASKNSFKSNRWGTFLQWRDNNRMIKAGEHGISVFKGFGDFSKIDDKGEIHNESRPLGFARVFNEDQTRSI